MNPISPSEARARLVAIALAEVGVRESGGNNRGKRIREYQEATWLAPAPWPWCAAFVVWCIMIWLEDEEVRQALGVAGPRVGRWRPQTAGAFDLENWARKNGLAVLPENAEARAGDIIVFDFSHVGFVSKDAHPSASVIATIEGNTNGRGQRDSTSGDGVWEKQRDRPLARSFIRLI